MIEECKDKKRGRSTYNDRKSIKTIHQDLPGKYKIYADSLRIVCEQEVETVEQLVSGCQS